MSGEPVDHRAKAEMLLRLWAEDHDIDSDQQRWEFLTAANAHATLAMQGTQEMILSLNARLLVAMTAQPEESKKKRAAK